MSISPVCVGIDVSKAHLDIFDPLEGSSRIDNTTSAVTAFAATQLVRGRFVVFEATGGYDRALRRGLEAAGVPHARVNPEQARDFARALGRRAKTDAVDARLLADFGRALAPKPRPPSDLSRENLAMRHKRRDQLVAMRQQEVVRRNECEDAATADSLTRHLAWLDKEIEAIEDGIRAAIAADQSLREAERRLRSVPGVGPVAAATMLALMPELGQRSPKAIAALVGLAPFNNDSGKRHGQRMIRGGRARVRRALYMAALSAANSKTRLGDFARKLRAAGKPPKLVLIALARKIIVILNAICRDNASFAQP
ncbi:MAG: IS110 family transposase [Methylocystis sp.]